MPSLAVVRAANTKFSPAYKPVALVVGGTAGIGQAVAEAIAAYTKGNAHIIVCGRNEAAAESIISGLPKDANSTYEFVQCDATLMSNVHATTTELSSRLDRLNYLVLSAGAMSLKGRNPTSEGIDRKLALNYYSRFAFTTGLLPLLEKAAAEGQDARVMSILGAGQGGPIDLNDLGLEKSYGLRKAADTAITCNDCFALEAAARHPTVSFTHIFPGIVKTDFGTAGLPFVLKQVTNLLSSLIAISTKECADFMFYALTDPGAATGGWSKNNHAEPVPSNKYATEEARTKVWEYSAEVTAVKT